MSISKILQFFTVFSSVVGTMFNPQLYNISKVLFYKILISLAMFLKIIILKFDNYCCNSTWRISNVHACELLNYKAQEIENLKNL